MNIEIPDDCKVAHVLFSGGVDSTLLLYKLLESQQNRYSIKCYGMKMTKNTDAYIRCQHILSVLKERFQCEISFVATSQHFWIKTFVKNILEIEGGYVFTGCNKVLDFLQPTVIIPFDTPPVRGEPYNEYHLRPFINIEKDVLIQEYLEQDILDLLNLTYSCGHHNTIPCDACYFCLERSWGLERCGINSINI